MLSTGHKSLPPPPPSCGEDFMIGFEMYFLQNFASDALLKFIFSIRGCSLAAFNRTDVDIVNSKNPVAKSKLG